MRQFIQCRPALKQQLRVRQIVFGHAVAVVLLDPFGQCAVQRCRHDNPWVDGRQFGFVERDTQSKASRATAVLHALLEIEDFHFADQAAGAGQTLQVLPDTLVATAFFRHDQQHGAVRTRQQLAIEQVGTNGIFHAHCGTRYAD
ncbi:hypothetical protein D3C73_826390 [compost metagenome]